VGCPLLTKIRVCRLQLLLALAAQSFKCPSSAGLMTKFYSLRFEIPPTQVPVFISPRNRVARLYLWALGSVSVASYDSQGYGGSIRTSPHAGRIIKAKVTLRLTVYRQLVFLCAKPLETHDQKYFFSQLNACGNSP
jgi:hypothetical protein